MANGNSQPVDLLSRRKLYSTPTSDHHQNSPPRRNTPANRSVSLTQKSPVSNKSTSSQSSSINRNDTLGPSIIVPHTSTVFQACQKMAALRTTSLLVVEDQSHSNSPSVLVGIVTDKDIAYKVIAEGLDPTIVLISSIMTPNPITIQSNTSMSDALSIMTERHFRHLPVVTGNIFCLFCSDWGNRRCFGYYSSHAMRY